MAERRTAFSAGLALGVAALLFMAGLVAAVVSNIDYLHDEIYSALPWTKGGVCELWNLAALGVAFWSAVAASFISFLAVRYGHLSPRAIAMGRALQWVCLVLALYWLFGPMTLGRGSCDIN